MVTKVRKWAAGPHCIEIKGEQLGKILEVISLNKVIFLKKLFLIMYLCVDMYICGHVSAGVHRGQGGSRVMGSCEHLDVVLSKTSMSS